MQINGNNNSKNDDDDMTVIDFEESSERIRRLKKKTDKGEKQKTPKEPLFNLPSSTKLLVMLMVIPHLIITIWGQIDFEIPHFVYTELGFVPADWTSGTANLFSLMSLFTYNFIHGGTLHIIMNTVMALAFATGVERFMGGKRMLQIFFLTSLFGVLAHTVFYPQSLSPVIGASAGLNGLFGVLLIQMKNQGMMGRAIKIMPFVLFWTIITILFGSMGTPEGGAVAWIAHLGGFYAGLAITRLRYFQ